MATKKEYTQYETGRDGLQIAQRSMVYIVRMLLFVIMGCIVCIAAFLTAERVSNLYILTSEGMALRAECILADGSRNDLQEYFTLSWLDSDAELNAGVYDHYTVSSYNYDLTVEKISVLPWSMVAAVTVTERVSVKGSVNEDQLSEGQNAAEVPLPAWTPVRYKLHYINADGRWYISELETLEVDPPQKTQGTPDPNQSPIPAATPTPAPTDPPVVTLQP